MAETIDNEKVDVAIITKFILPYLLKNTDGVEEVRRVKVSRHGEIV